MAGRILPLKFPSDVKKSWEAIGSRGSAERGEWDSRMSELSDGRRKEFNRVISGEPPRKLSATIKALKKQTSEAKPKVATRKSSENVLEVINPIMPETIGGSADLTGSEQHADAGSGHLQP